jgi:hypothetical protein
MPGLSPPPLGGKLSASNSGGRGLRGGGIPSRWARGHGSEVSHGVDHEVPVSSATRGCRGAGSRADPSDLRGAGSDHHPGSGLAGSYPYVGGGAAADLAVEAGAVHQGAVVAAVATRVPSLAETLLGAAPVGPGGISARVGARSTKPRVAPISRTNSGTRMWRGSRSPVRASLEPALSRAP